MSFFRELRTIISGDYREFEKNYIEAHNKKILNKYKNHNIYGILRVHSDEGGLFCLFLKVIGGIRFCKQHGIIPVVDMQTKENIFTTPSERRNNNAWEYFFEQPSDISYLSVKKCKNKIILDNPTGPGFALATIDNKDSINYWRKLVNKYIKPSKEVLSILEKYECQITNHNCLGILARGTDYKKSTASGHPIQPSCEELIEKAKYYISEKKVTKIFLATEDQDILDKMTSSFGEMILSIPQKRYTSDVTCKLGHMKDYAKDSIEMNRSYLASILMLSKCNYFISGISGGMLGTYLFSEGFDECWICNRGNYGEDDIDSLI